MVQGKSWKQIELGAQLLKACPMSAVSHAFRDWTAVWTGHLQCMIYWISYSYDIFKPLVIPVWMLSSPLDPLTLLKHVGKDCP